MSSTDCRLLLALSFTLPVGSFAAEMKPSDPAATAPPVTYRSVFEGYKPFKEETVSNWRALNEEVGLVGGHVGIMGGAGGHAGPGESAKRAPTITTEGGQPPIRTAPKAPGGSHSH